MKLLPLATRVACAFVVCVSAASAQSGARLRAPGAQQELQAKAQGQADTPRTATPTATVSYSGTINATPTFNRPFDCATLSGTGTAVGFEARSFTVDTTGSYTLEVTAYADAGADSFLVLYTPSFSPGAPLTNCVAFDDDGGAGLFSLITTNLTAGTQYVLVTTTYDNGVSSTFTNTITGPGNITVGAPPASANVAITIAAPTGVPSSGNYTYLVTATNAGPNAATGVSAAINIGAGVTVTGNTCGATGAGGALTWAIGALANAATLTCTINVTAGATCAGVTASAAVSSTSIDPVATNNTSTTTNQSAFPQGGFEAGTPNPVWTEASTNFGTPICDVAGCGTGGGSAGPASGTFWVWFGGFPGGAENGSVQQSLVIPTGTTTLTFASRLGLCANGASDFVRLTIDGTELWRRNGTDASCAAAGYSTNSVNIASFAGTTPHVVRFESTTIGGTVSNFNLDDISWNAPAVCTAPTGGNQPVLPVDTLSPYGLLALLLGVLAIGFVAVQRRNAA
jgi:hypothetical protein